MKFNVLISGLTAIALGLGALAAQAQNDPNVQELANEWTLAYNTQDIGDLAGLYAEDAELMLHGEPTITGRSAIRDYWRQDFQAGNPITSLTVTHSLQGADMILVHGNYRVINRTNGVLEGQGRFAHIWKLTVNGDWELDRDLWSSAFNPYGPAQ